LFLIQYRDMGDIIEAYLKIHVALAPIISIFLRTASVVLAPIPGTPIDLLNLALFGKLAGFIYAEISIMLGSSINFLIARKFREPVVRKFISLEKIHVWEERINEKSGFWGLVSIRCATILIFDYLSYVAGLTKMSFGKFFMSSFISTLPLMALFYYFGGILLEKEFYWIIIFLIPIFVIFSLFHERKIFKRFYDYLSTKSNINKINDFLKRNREKNQEKIG